MFTPPINSYTDYYEQAKFRLTWNLNVMLTVLLTIITFIFVYVHPDFVAHYGIGAGLAISSLIYMKVKKEYKLISIILSTSGLFLVSSSFFLVSETPHYIEPFWLLIISMYTYFILGKKWGFVHLILNIIVVDLYLIYGYNSTFEFAATYSIWRYISMAGEFTICILLLSYVIHEFIKANKYARDKYTEANDLALVEKQNVEKQNKEKTVLLQEIHHRVKNNLQVITSLLRLQSSKISSKESKVNFQDAINRIMTMALIHQKMYEGDNLAEIDLKDYFSELLNDLISSNSTGKEIELDIDIVVNSVGAKSIVPLALIITELVTNSIKHGFDNKPAGVISLSIQSVESDSIIKLDYSDDGDWKESESDTSLGIELIDAFTEQLDGRYEFKVIEGKSMYQFVFDHNEHV